MRPGRSATAAGFYEYTSVDIDLFSCRRSSVAKLPELTQNQRRDCAAKAWPPGSDICFLVKAKSILNKYSRQIINKTQAMCLCNKIQIWSFFPASQRFSNKWKWQHNTTPKLLNIFKNFQNTTLGASPIHRLHRCQNLSCRAEARAAATTEGGLEALARRRFQPSQWPKTGLPSLIITIYYCTIMNDVKICHKLHLPLWGWLTKGVKMEWEGQKQLKGPLERSKKEGETATSHIGSQPSG